MKVLMLTRYSRLGASSRLRGLQYADLLADEGIELEVSALLDDAYLQTIYRKERVPLSSLFAAYGSRLRVLLGAQRFDLVWIEKELFPNWPSWFEWLLVQSGVPYVVDYDDAIFHNYDLSANPLKRLLKNKIGRVMRHAALVVGGNSYLLQHALDAGAENVALLPTVIDIRRYPLRDREPSAASDGRLVIGWIGSPATSPYLRALGPILEELSKVFPLALHAIGAEPGTMPHRFVRYIPWREDTEAAEIGRFDIGVMPLPDGPYERGKCGYKLIQYMACGKPVVGSPVGVNGDIVEHGASGFLADGAGEWRDALERLLADAALRRAMGLRGRALTEQKYCVQVTAPKLARLFESIVSQRRGSLCVD